MSVDNVKALTFDVFGTVVDWRSSLIAEGEVLTLRHGIENDWGAFADAWRGMYQPAMERVRTGQRAWTRLDDLHRESLDALVPEWGLKSLSDNDLDDLNRAWHRLQPWPDSVPGLTRLRTRFILATLSNGNVSLMVNMAKNAGLPWDAILGAEPTRHYKPQPGAYLGTAAFLDLPPEQCMLVAAHNDDLVAAARVGFRTAFIPRPTEYGPDQTRDAAAEHDFDVIARDMEDLATKLGCE